jgi:hypothetical protein
VTKICYLESVQDEIVYRFCFVKIIIVTGGTFTDAVNEIAEVAYDDNMTYDVRIHDDTRFISPNCACSAGDDYDFTETKALIISSWTLSR